MEVTKMKNATLLPNTWKRSFPSPITLFTIILLHVFGLFPVSSWGFGFLQGYVRDDSAQAIKGSEFDRIMITSVTDTQEAVILNQGRLSFSWQFWASMFSGSSFDANPASGS
jgi:hypothetical protein